MVRTLLDAGSPFREPASNGYTPIAVAAENGHVGVVSALLGAGADAGTAGVLGHTQGRVTPLLRALDRGHRSVAGLLQEALVRRMSSHAARAARTFTIR